MKSVFGPVITEGAGIFDIQLSKAQAIKSLEIAKNIYQDFKVTLLDLNNINDRLRAIDVDVDLGDMKGYVILIEVPEI
ncbi:MULTISPECIES: hypothetical protein [Acidianus]|uniref:Uncharacterized protein n=1 Tax=Candidatus Acidianus copahuensis TaxID=1160895 RepID=A0A031LMR7_9CREN|nr:MULTISPECIES: hypothetical protein [Acidianus]EZQ04761.1 hypothetical protein CM19_08590 [Candidatus Acidianus copahuensis]NON62378.1 hypothetical protein [Acidianus sp. RZ1]